MDLDYDVNQLKEKVIKFYKNQTNSIVNNYYLDLIKYFKIIIFWRIYIFD